MLLLSVAKIRVIVVECWDRSTLGCLLSCFFPFLLISFLVTASLTLDRGGM